MAVSCMVCRRRVVIVEVRSRLALSRVWNVAADIAHCDIYRDYGAPRYMYRALSRTAISVCSVSSALLWISDRCAMIFATIAFATSRSSCAAEPAELCCSKACRICASSECIFRARRSQFYSTAYSDSSLGKCEFSNAVTSRLGSSCGSSAIQLVAFGFSRVCFEKERVYLQQNKKKAKAESKNCHVKTMLSLQKPIKLI